jgi:hypothetical protein
MGGGNAQAFTLSWLKEKLAGAQEIEPQDRENGLLRVGAN